MARSHIQHLAETEGTADRAAAHGALTGDKRESMYAHRRGRHADEAQDSRRPQCLEIVSPILVGIGGVRMKSRLPATSFMAFDSALFTK